MLDDQLYDNLVFTGTIVEILARETANMRSHVMNCLGKDNLYHIYRTADVWHCLPMERVLEEVIADFCDTPLAEGNNPIWKSTMYKLVEKPRVAAKIIPRMVERLASDVNEAFDLWWDLYHSWMEHDLFDFDDIVYWQSTEYHLESYQNNDWL